MSIQAMKQALEALGYGYDAARCTAAVETIRNAESALRAAIAEAERQEPVAEVTCFGHDADIHPMITYNARLMCNFEAGNYHLYTTPQPAIPAWKPIETAPRDGTDVLIYTMAGSMYVAAYDDAFSNVWRIRNDEGVNARVVTHWMPLPAAPENGHD